MLSLLGKAWPERLNTVSKLSRQGTLQNTMSSYRGTLSNIVDHAESCAFSLNKNGRIWHRSFWWSRPLESLEPLGYMSGDTNMFVSKLRLQASKAHCQPKHETEKHSSYNLQQQSMATWRISQSLSMNSKTLNQGPSFQGSHKLNC